MNDEPTQPERDEPRPVGLAQKLRRDKIWAAVDSLPSAPSRRLGRFEVKGRIGRGGMGTVLEAYDASLERTVALKLLHPRAAVHHAGRLRREALALAKLSHPNVVQVYEVGEQDGQWFIAMEFVPGQTLRQWNAQEHGWRECVQLYLQVGEGLAAAHAAGLVHRDFKPDNCIIDEQGRPRVLDFGLVSATDVPSREIEEGLTELHEHGSDTVVTRTGTVLGTLTYMPLEQLRGQSADARSDQFAFCSSLYEALYARRPFAGKTVEERRRALEAGPIQAPPPSSKVPASLRRIVWRGLATDPDERWPSMNTLLGALRREVTPARPSAAVLGVSGAVGALGLGALVYAYVGPQDGDPPPSCGRAEHGVTSIWSDARRAAVARSLERLDAPHEAFVREQAPLRLDDHARQISALRLESCRAHADGSLAPGLYERRSACLEDRERALSAVVDVLADGDRRAAEHALDAIDRLRPVEGCADGWALEFTPLAPPNDAAEVARLRDSLARAKALEDTAQHDAGRSLAAAVLEDARTLGFAPLLVEAQLRDASLRYRTGAYDEAARGYSTAAQVAEAHGLESAAIEAMTEWMYVLGHEGNRPETALVVASMVEAKLEHTQLDERFPGGLFLNYRGAVRRVSGDYAGARADLERSIEILEDLGEGHSSTLAAAVGNLGNVHVERGEYADAESCFARTVTLWTRLHGPEHPAVAQVLSRLADVQTRTKRYDEASATYERTLEIQERALGVDHVQVAQTLSGLSALRGQQERLAESEQLAERVLRIFENKLGDDSRYTAEALINLAHLGLRQGHLLRAYERVERAEAVLRRAVGAEHPSVADALVLRGRIDLRRGQPRAASLAFDRALELRQRAEVDPLSVARTRFELAMALEASGERARARALVVAAKEAVDALGAGNEDARAELEQWLATHGP